MQHLLVIDDDPAVISLFKRGLSYEGFARVEHPLVVCFADLPLDSGRYLVLHSQRGIVLTSTGFQRLQELLLPLQQALSARAWGYDFDANQMSSTSLSRNCGGSWGKPRLPHLLRNVGSVLRKR